MAKDAKGHGSDKRGGDQAAARELGQGHPKSDVVAVHPGAQGPRASGIKGHTVESYNGHNINVQHIFGNTHSVSVFDNSNGKQKFKAAYSSRDTAHMAGRSYVDARKK